jgi:hypothetical protein
MIGAQDISKFLINFDPSAWANQANAQLQNALNSGLNYSQNYNQQAVNALQNYQGTADNQLQQGFNQSQALNAPKQLATYNALDAYQNLLGLPTPAGGSFQLAQGLSNGLSNQPNTPMQAQQSAGYNQGVMGQSPSLLGGMQPPQLTGQPPQGGQPMSGSSLQSPSVTPGLLQFPTQQQGGIR